ncbi:MAG: response regulator [Verrucomicrobiae bacterium]|nr:response regulator [Verrucomicrobiae bacterium]
MAGDAINILHIEDNPMEAMLMRELVSVSLPDTHALIPAGSLAEAREKIAVSRPDLILLDLSLPDISGIDTIHELRPHVRGIPIIVLSGYDDEKTSIAALRAGAQDYLVKGEVSSHLLRHAIRYSVERKRLDAALATERDLVDTLLEHIPDRVYFKDLESRYLRINRAMANLFDLEDPTEATGRSDNDFFADDYAAQSQEDERSVIESGVPLIGYIERETLKNGDSCWVLTTKMPLTTSDNEIIGTFGISRDITQFKETEEELEKALTRNRHLSSDLKRLAALTADEIETAVDEVRNNAKAGTRRLERAAERLIGISRLDRDTQSLAKVSLHRVFTQAMTRLMAGDGNQIELVFKPENFPTAIGNEELLVQLALEILRSGSQQTNSDRFEIRANESDHFLETTVGPAGSLSSGLEFSPATVGASGLTGELAFTLCSEILGLHGGELLAGPKGIVRFTLPRNA